jgi:hypothetical protein
MPTTITFIGGGDLTVEESLADMRSRLVDVSIPVTTAGGEQAIVRGEAIAYVVKRREEARPVCDRPVRTHSARRGT